MDAAVGLTFQLAAVALIDSLVVKRLWRGKQSVSKKALIAIGVVIASLVILCGTMIL